MHKREYKMSDSGKDSTYTQPPKFHKITIWGLNSEMEREIVRAE